MAEYRAVCMKCGWTSIGPGENTNTKYGSRRNAENATVAHADANGCPRDMSRAIRINN